MSRVVRSPVGSGSDNSVVVLGAGGHARVVVAAVLASGRKVAAIAAPEGAEELARRVGVPVITDDGAVLDLDAATVDLVVGVGTVSPSPHRRHIFERFRGAGFRFATVVHPAAIVDADVFLGEGTVVMAGAIIQAGCRLGDNVIVNTGAVVEHDCLVGDHVHLASGCVVAGGVQIGAGAVIGAGATVIQSLSIGTGALVAAAAAVVRDIEPDARVGGVPARPL